jgi:hypothetical protein
MIYKNRVDWDNSIYKSARSPRSICLPVGEKVKLLDDLEDFFSLECEAFYATNGIARRKGYLGDRPGWESHLGW